jgi:exodeoxyribonuclease V beta subunit
LLDEPEAPAPVSAGAETVAGLDVPSPMGGMPVGVRFGTFVHRVFEATDFAAEDLDSELGGHIETALQRRSLEAGGTGELVAGLRAAIETPLGPLAGGLRLRDIPRSARLNELTFELPLVGGDDPTGRLTLSGIAAVLQDHLPAGDPLAAYATRLQDPALRSSVRGFLTGSIDLVVRMTGDPGPRFLIADYKTNWLGAVDEELTLGQYVPEALVAEMSRAHYGLQALLYTVALHRYLRWRLPDYDPERHVAGVLYLFLRGMAGPETPVVGGAPCGVFAWRPPGPMVSALSDVLDRGAPGA